MPLPQAFLFDMDGLLVDTEELHLRTWAEVATRHGIPSTAEDLHGWVGKGQPALAAWIRETAGCAASVEEILLEQEARYLEDLETDRPPPLPGVRELVDLADAEGIPRGLVSTSPYSLVAPTMAVVLPTLGRPARAEESFGVVVTGDRVEHHKPHPEPYRKAAAGLGVDPARCVVFEDSPSGVRAGKAAGCRVVGVPSAYLLEPEAVRAVADVHHATLLECFEARSWELEG